MIPLDDALRPTWLFGATVHEGCDRAGYYEQGDFATEYGSPKCIVKLGCWGPVVKCNVPKRGWINGVGGCPNVGGICIGCTMPGFPDKFMPFMDEPPGGSLDDGRAGCTATIRRLREITAQTLDKEPKWRTPGGELITGATRPGEPTRSDAALRAVDHGRRRRAHATTADASADRPRRDGLGPDHPHRREPRDLHEDRLRRTRGRRVPQHVVDLPRLQHLHEGQGPARRALHHQPHLRHLRRQPRHLLLLRAEHGLRREAAAPGRVDRQPRRGRRVHVRPQHLPGEPGRGRLLREDGRRDQPRRARAGQPHRGAARRRPRLPHHRRHHAVAEPVHRRVLPRGAAGQPATRGRCSA